MIVAAAIDSAIHFVSGAAGAAVLMIRCVVAAASRPFCCLRLARRGGL